MPLENKNKDIVLWNELKKGSMIALGSIYDLYVDELFLYGCKITPEVDVVQDSIHDLFLDLYKYKNNLADTTNVKFYLLSSLKKKILKNPEFKKKTVVATPKKETDVIHSIEEIFIQDELTNERSEKLSKALQSLPKKQREGIFLKFMQNKTYEEIAEIMNIKVETSRTIVYRGLKSLKDICMVLVGFILSLW